MNPSTRRRLKLALFGLGGLALVAVVFVIAAFAYLKAELPALTRVADYQPPQVTRIYSDDGQLVGELFREKRTVVPIEVVPKHVVHAFLAAEDAKFYEHEGIDYFGILRAAIKNLRPGAHLQGASTITQQIVKTLVVGPERSYVRKMREALLSRELEQLLTKDEILYIYLNQIYFGSGAHGVEEAARVYFGKSVREVTLGEAALLASIPKNPSHYTPAADPAAAKQRQVYVLEQMRQNGWATPEEVKKLEAEPVPMPPTPPRYLGVGPQYVEHVKKLLADKYGEDTVLTRGYTVYVGMVARMQAAAHLSLRRGLEALARQQGYPGARLRIEVDRLGRFKKALHEALDARLHKRRAYAKTRGGLLLWDLSEITDQTVADETKVPEALRLTTVEEGDRLTGLVDRVDSVGKTISVDLGTTRGVISFKTLGWARRFSPLAGTPSPHDPSDVVREGDLVEVELGPVPPTLGKAPLKLDLVPEPKAEAALVALDPYTRLVRAVVGGYRPEAGGLNRALQSRRQPGSAFKPLVYAAGIAEGAITPASLCADSPILIRDPWTGAAWKPENFEDGKYDGTITYRTALMRSKNTCSVKLIEKVKPDKVIAVAKAAGVDSPLPENLTLALGTGDVRPIELANAYAMVASGGLFAPPIFIRKVVDQDGTVLEDNRAEPTEAVKPEVAYVLTQMMRSVVEGGTATKALVLDRPLAGKTGTSQDARNVWFSGFSAELVATVWVGFDDNSPLGRVTGGSTALPIWIDFMGRALSGVPVREFTEAPDNVVMVKVDPGTGQPSEGPDAIDEAFVAGTEPSKSTATLPSIFLQDDTAGGGPH